MASGNDLSLETLPLSEGPFNLLLPPSRQETKLGGHEDAAITVTEFEVHIGNRPRCRNLRDLYEKTHREFPPDLEIFDQYDIWVITHAIGAIRREGWANVKALGYQADFEEDQVCTIDLVPGTKFHKWFGTTLGVEADVGIEGTAQTPAPNRLLLDEEESLGGSARLKLSAEAKVVGRLSFSIMTPVIVVVGFGHSRCEWRFEKDQNPLLGDQLMFQTVLVPAGTPSLKMRIRGYALIKPSWISFPSMFHTNWLDVEVGPASNLASSSSENSPGAPAKDDLLGPARARGQKAMEELLAEEGPPLSAAEVSTRLHLTPAEVEQRRRAGRLIAVERGTAGYVYPAWQFVKDQTLPGLEEVLAELPEANPWVVIRFFLNGNFRLQEKSPLQELRRGKIEDVKRAARNFGEQGAV